MYEHTTRLTSSEIASLWTAYMNDSMSQCILGAMLENIEDSDIKEVLQSSYNVSVNHQEQLSSIFAQEDFATPIGFNEKDDVYHGAPWLFSDIFCLSFVNHMS